jgi:hypothetical protein
MGIVVFCEEIEEVLQLELLLFCKEVVKSVEIYCVFVEV